MDAPPGSPGSTPSSAVHIPRASAGGLGGSPSTASIPTKQRGAPVVRTLALADEVFTVAEVARLLKVSVAKVYVMIDRGELEAFRVGTHFRVRRASLEVFMHRAR